MVKIYECKTFIRTRNENQATYIDYKWKKCDKDLLFVYKLLNFFWAFLKPIKHAESNHHLSSKAWVYKKHLIILHLKNPFQNRTASYDLKVLSVFSFTVLIM